MNKALCLVHQSRKRANDPYDDRPLMPKVGWEITPEPPPHRHDYCSVHGHTRYTSRGECVRCVTARLTLDAEPRCPFCGRRECSH